MDYAGLKPLTIHISGTGSMYPTFPKSTEKTPKEQAEDLAASVRMLPYPNGIMFLGNKYLNYEIGRGDIIVAENENIAELNLEVYGRESGWVKRIVGLPGDKIELREGLVNLNGMALIEPYTAQAHSTFGENFLTECMEIEVPEDSYFIMGDNRKGSGDSREIGFVNKSEIKNVLPLNWQHGKYDQNWRDTSNDLNESSKIKLEPLTYFEILNSKRDAAGIAPLKYQKKLESSARKRGEVILRFDDLSFEATMSGYTQEKAMLESGYSNIIYGEIPTLGFYEADELIEHEFELKSTEEFLLNPEFEEMGLASVEGKLNGCPTQVIVQHFAGYKPPNYSQESVDSWDNALNKINEAITSWEQGLGVTEINQDELKKLLDNLKEEKQIAETIYNKMAANLWLSKSEERSIEKYNQLVREAIELSQKIAGSSL